jgi:aminoglycoside phosphotransferase (APT) family kinase protein
LTERAGSWLARLATATARRPIVPGGSARSGSLIERVTLADGRTVIVKHLDPRLDLMLRGLDDHGRLARLWDAGVFERMPRVVEHGMLGVEPEDDGWVVVMEDLGSALLPDDRPVSRAESRQMLAAAAQIHERFAGEDLPVGPVAGLYRFLSPALAVAEAGSPNQLPGLIGRGWARFAEAVPPDVAAAIAAIHGAPDRFAAAFAGSPTTLVHGDYRFANLGLHDDRVVVIDWGSSCVRGPAALDLAWYLIVGATRIEATRDEVIHDFIALEGARHDPRALGLALIGALAQLGWNKALDVLENDDPLARARERADLDWWVARVRRELDAWGPI